MEREIIQDGDEDMILKITLTVKDMKDVKPILTKLEAEDALLALATKHDPLDWHKIARVASSTRKGVYK